MLWRYPYDTLGRAERDCLGGQTVADAYDVVSGRTRECGVLVLGVRGDIKDCNPAAVEILEADPRDWPDGFHICRRWTVVDELGGPMSHAECPLTVSLTTGKPAKNVLIGLRNPGAEKWLRLSTTPLYGPNSALSGVAIAFSEVSEERRRIQELEQGIERNAIALDAAEIGIWEWDIREGRLTWSEGLEQVLGIDSSTFDGTVDGLLRITHPDDHDYIWRGFERRKIDTPKYRMTIRVFDTERHIRWIESVGRVLCDAEGLPCRAVGSIRDVSARRQLELQLAYSQRMETLGRIAGGIAHDFNNLLTATMGFVELAKLEAAWTDSVVEALDTICEASERGGRLTRQLLTFARKQAFQLETFDLKVVVGESIRLLKRVLGGDVRLTTHLCEAPLWICADRGQIEQLLLNLAVNAREAMPHGGELMLRLDSGGSENETTAVLVVSDSGIGIERSELERIFEPFFTTKTNGTGLGLSTCYGVVSQLGGSIRASSEVGEGATFTIRLPCVSESEAYPRPSDSEPSEITVIRGTVLVVEDNSVLRDLAVRSLRKDGHDVVAVGWPDEALMVLESRDIDVLVTDIVLPGFRGDALARRAVRRDPSLKVLFVSGLKTSEELQGAPFLPKPYSLVRLRQTVRQLLHERAEEERARSESL